MTINKTILALMILISSHVKAQQVSFQTFLSEHKKVDRLDSTSFGRPYTFIEHEDLYSEFLPSTNDDCLCNQKDIRWQKGSYVVYKNFIAVALQRYCLDFQDGNSQWFMENDGTDYMLITYSHDGKIIDHKKLCHSGTAYPLRIETSDKGRILVVEQKVLDDCSLLLQYKNLEYTVNTHKFFLQSNGKIKKRIIKAPYKETKDALSSLEQFSFEQFKAYFHKQDASDINHRLFFPSGDGAELPFESCLSLIPDTLDPNCWPRSIQWIPCQYIESEDIVYFFVIKDCSTPKIGFLPYGDYMILEFRKDGTYLSARSVYHWSDDSIMDEPTKNNLITKTLKSIFVERKSN